VMSLTVIFFQGGTEAVPRNPQVLKSGPRYFSIDKRTELCFSSIGQAVSARRLIPDLVPS